MPRPFRGTIVSKAGGFGRSTEAGRGAVGLTRRLKLNLVCRFGPRGAVMLAGDRRFSRPIRCALPMMALRVRLSTTPISVPELPADHMALSVSSCSTGHGICLPPVIIAYVPLRNLVQSFNRWETRYSSTLNPLPDSRQRISQLIRNPLGSKFVSPQIILQCHEVKAPFPDQRSTECVSDQGA